MKPSEHRLVHVAPWINGIGGVETLMTHHRREDAKSGFDAHQVALFDKKPGKELDRYSSLRFSWRDTARQMRRTVRDTLAAHSGSIVLWHSWGTPWFADVDSSSRRIVCLWENEPQFAPWLKRIAPLVDGVTYMSAGSGEAVARLLPNLPAERRLFLPVPIAPPIDLAEVRGGNAGRELVIGCAGRLVKTPKRWERLIPFVDELTRLGMKFRVEIVSDGPMRRFLERRLGGNPAVKFLGWQSAESYWSRLGHWDAAAFFSDFEGGPIVMLEAMAAGVVPFYPRIGGSLGDDYAPSVHPLCYYPAGDPRAAARAIQEIFALPSDEISQLRARAQRLVAAHQAERYQEAFATFVRTVATLPRISTAPLGGRPSRFSDWLPLGAITRLFPSALLR